MKLLAKLFVSIFFLTFACKNADRNSDATGVSKKPGGSQNLKAGTPEFLDTTIHLIVSKEKYSSNTKLTSSQSKQIVYHYFKQKGVLPKDEINSSKASLSNDLCITYDTIYRIATNAFQGAIASYWLGPPDLNGHCFQPSKAFIQATNHGYVVSNENFIPPNLAIDSSVGPYVYGYDYDCGGKGIVRRFKIKLE